jgi:hypothetical protein
MANEESLIDGKILKASIDEYGDLTVTVQCIDGEMRTISANTNEWLIESQLPCSEVPELLFGWKGVACEMANAK